MYEAWQAGNTVTSTFRHDCKFINVVIDVTLFAFAYVRKYSSIHSSLRTAPSSVVRLTVCRLNNIDGRLLNMECKASVELKLRK